MSGDVQSSSAGLQGRVDRTATVRRMFEDAFNLGDFSTADELTAPDAIAHDPNLPRDLQNLRGPEQFKRVVSMYRQAFPDLRMAVEDTITEGDQVVLRWRSEGTHRGELLGLAPTGVRGSATGISITRWHNDKLVESWVEWDNLGLARQIGAAPPEGSAGERIGKAVQRLVARRRRKRTSA